MTVSHASMDLPNGDRALEHPWVIVGCGYTGSRLARRLVAAGAQVWITRRSAEDASATAQGLGLGVRGHALDLDAAEDLDAMAGWLPADAYLIHAAQPAKRGAEAERDLVRSAARVGLTRLVYLSSTGVYPKSDGRWLDEDSPVGPTSRVGRARLAAETTVLEDCASHGIPAVSLRVVGIYGPGRGVHARLLAKSYRIIGQGDTQVNRVHVDDLVSAIIAAATVPELPRRIYHVADDRPESSRVYADAVARVVGRPSPPSVDESSVAPWVAAMLGANRRISNQRIKQDLGLELAYPTWMDGLAQVLEEDGVRIVAPIPRPSDLDA